MSRTLLVIEVVSLDGVMQAPGRADEDDRDGFTHGGWASEAFAADPEAAGAQQSAMRDEAGPTVMLFGRRSYLDLLHQWLEVAGDNPFAASFRAQQKYVVSNTLAEPLPYENSTLLSGDAVARVRELKAAGDGTIVVLGSGDLVRHLARAGLVDQYLLNQIPVVLGSGQRLFDGITARLDVLASQASASGITLTHYALRRTG